MFARNLTKGKVRHYTISMPPDVMRLADEKRGLIERSTWLRYLILKELGLIPQPHNRGLEAPKLS
jgi:hypothetical protein